MLTQKQLQHIGSWIKQNARPLEKARFAYHFEGGGAQPVLSALSPYQNPDGGFGNALEADNWNPASSPLTSTVALRILYEVGFREQNDHIARCIDYLTDHHYDADTGTWATVLPSNNDYPHAPWWTWQENGHNTWNFNPGVEVAGLLLYYAAPHSSALDVARQSLKKAEAYLFGENQLHSDYHTIYCYIRALVLAQQSGRDAGVDLPKMQAKLMQYVEDTMCRDSGQWVVNYVPEPLCYMDDLNAGGLPIVEKYREDLIQNALFTIERLPEEGVWPISWSWGGLYPEEFALCAPIWQGVRAVENLIKFKRLGLIEGYTASL